MSNEAAAGWIGPVFKTTRFLRAVHKRTARRNLRLLKSGRLVRAPGQRLATLGGFEVNGSELHRLLTLQILQRPSYDTICPLVARSPSSEPGRRRPTVLRKGTPLMPRVFPPAATRLYPSPIPSASLSGTRRARPFPPSASAATTARQLPLPRRHEREGCEAKRAVCFRQTMVRSSKRLERVALCTNKTAAEVMPQQT